MKKKKLTWGCLWLLSLLFTTIIQLGMTTFANDQTLKMAEKQLAITLNLPNLPSSPVEHQRRIEFSELQPQKGFIPLSSQ